MWNLEKRDLLSDYKNYYKKMMEMDEIKNTNSKRNAPGDENSNALLGFLNRYLNGEI
jgi:hypothetical protein